MDRKPNVPASLPRFLFAPQLTLRLPLLAAIFIFASIGVTQYTILLRNQSSDHLLEKLGDVYLDGLVSANRDEIRTRDIPEITKNFRNAFLDQVGISEVSLFAFDDSRNLLVRMGDERVSVNEALAFLPDRSLVDHDRGMVLAARSVEGGKAGYVMAALNAADIIEFRNTTTLRAFLLHIAIGLAFSVFAYFVLRSVMKPIEQVTTRMLEARTGTLASMEPELIPSSDYRVAALFSAFNEMADAMNQRNQLARRLADQDRTIALGRLSAMLAHEVRNPLGGLKAAVSTIRRFGDDAGVRADAAGFLERGIGSIDRIVTGTLNFYRPADDLSLTPVDLEDLKLLVRTDAERRQVSIRWAVDIPPSMKIAAGGVRQVLLNLLLNACAATPKGGEVTCQVAYSDDALELHVINQGAEFPKSLLARLSATEDELESTVLTADGQPGIGTLVVGLMVRRMGGSIVVHGGETTTVRVRIPAERHDG